MKAIMVLRLRAAAAAADCRSISLIAGGTGITPCWQVIRTITDDPEDTTEVSCTLCYTL
jgi:NAD(P)H-flavin reductase